MNTGIPGTGIYSLNYLERSKRPGRREGADRARATRASPGPASGGAGTQGSAPVAVSVLRVPPALARGRVGWAWAVFSALLGFAWPPLFVAAVILALLAAASSASPRTLAAREVRQGLTAVRARNWPLAVERFRKAHEMLPDLPDLEGLVGFALAGAGRSEEALPHLEAGYAAVPDPSLGIVLAATALDCDRNDRAVEILQRLPPSLTELPAVVNLLGQAFLRMGHLEAAVEILKRGPVRKREMTPEKLECHYLLGQAYLGLGDKARARREFERVVAEDMDYKDVRALLEQARKTARTRSNEASDES